MLAGAVYVIAVPLGLLAEERVPHVGEQFDPFCIRDQETPVLLASLETVAVNCCVVPSKTFAAVGDKETDIGGGRSGGVGYGSGHDGHIRVHWNTSRCRVRCRSPARSRCRRNGPATR